MDTEGLYRILLNLASNAGAAMPAGGQLRIAARLAEATSEVILDVTDTGIGMSPETMERLFEPFFTTKPKGTGLGLVAIQTLLLLHGASIEVKSTPGEGSTFSLRLPTEPGNRGEP